MNKQISLKGKCYKCSEAYPEYQMGLGLYDHYDNRELYFCSYTCLINYLIKDHEPNRLKLVDDNCKNKPVFMWDKNYLKKDSFGALIKPIRILDNIVKTTYGSIGYSDGCNIYNYAERITNEDYGDGGNYER